MRLSHAQTEVPVPSAPGRYRLKFSKPRREPRFMVRRHAHADVLAQEILPVEGDVAGLLGGTADLFIFLDDDEGAG